MKATLISLFITVALILGLSFKFIILRAPDSRLLYTVKNDTFLETIQVSGIFHKTATDTEKATALTAYESALSALATTKQNKQSADAMMWSKRQAVLVAKNGVNYKDDNTTNPATKEDYTLLEKMNIDSALTQAEKDFQASETKFKEADASIIAANAQVKLTKIAYNDSLENDPTLTVFVSEIYAPKITVGQKVVIVFDAMKDISLTGEVKSIDPAGTIVGGFVTFETKIQLNEQPASVRPNMTAIANIEIIRKDNTLAIPLSSLIKIDQDTYVQKADDPDGHLTKIITGIRGFTKVEVISGIDAGTVILARPNSKTK